MTEAAALAEVHLLGLIAQAHEPGPDDDASPASFEGALDAAIAVGLVAPEDKAAWLERYARQAATGPPPPAEVPMERAFELLDRLRRDAADDDDENLAAHIQFNDAREALAAVGALDAGEVEWWADSDAEDDDELEYWEHGGRLAALLAAFPGDPAAATRAAWVASVECYDDGIVVRWHARPDGQLDEDDETDLDVRLADDAGTTYEPTGSSSGSGAFAGATVVEGDTTFFPALPATARTLRVTWPGGALELDVAGVAERPPL